jgi:hypothetical protein
MLPSASLGLNVMRKVEVDGFIHEFDDILESDDLMVRKWRHVLGHKVLV